MSRILTRPRTPVAAQLLSQAPHFIIHGAVRVHTSDSITRGLTPFIFSRNRCINVTNRSTPLAFGSTAFISTPAGYSANFDESTDTYISAGDTTLTPSSGQWSAIVGFSARSGGDGYVFAARDGSNRRWALYSEGGKIRANPWTSVSLSNTGSYDYKISGISGDTGSGACVFYHNGKSDGAGTSAGEAGGFAETIIGGIVGGLSLFGGIVTFAYFFNRQLTANEHARIARYPLCVFEPAYDRAFVYSAGAPPAGNIARQHYHHRHHNRAG